MYIYTVYIYIYSENFWKHSNRAWDEGGYFNISLHGNRSLEPQKCQIRREFSRKAPDVAILQITGIGFFLHVTIGLLKLGMNDGVI